MKYIHIAGIQRSGKTTTFLNIRRACDALWSDKTIEVVGPIVFVGSGLNRKQYRRLSGADRLSQSSKELLRVGRQIHDLDREHAGKADAPKVCITDSLHPVFNRRNTEVRFCWMDASLLQERVPKHKLDKTIPDYLEFQERLLLKFRSMYDRVVVWDSRVSLEQRVKEVCGLAGLAFNGAPISDFRAYWGGADLEETVNYHHKYMGEVSFKDCQGCPSSCCVYGGIVNVGHGDIHRLARTIGIEHNEVIRRYCRHDSEGNLTLARKDFKDLGQSPCIFLSEKETGKMGCSVYEGRPDICRGYTPNDCMVKGIHPSQVKERA